MNVNIEDILKKIKQDILSTFRENYLSKRFDYNDFITQVDNYLNKLMEDNLLVETKVKRTKLPRKFKKKYKKERVVYCEIYVKPSINYSDFKFEFNEYSENKELLNEN